MCAAKKDSCVSSCASVLVRTQAVVNSSKHHLMGRRIGARKPTCLERQYVWSTAVQPQSTAAASKTAVQQQCSTAVQQQRSAAAAAARTVVGCSSSGTAVKQRSAQVLHSSSGDCCMCALV